MSASLPPLKSWADVLHERQTVRRFRPEPLPVSLVQRLVSAATRAPSAHNRQPWRFCVLREKPGKLALAEAMGQRLRADRERDGDDAEAVAADVRRSYDRVSAAPVAILVCLTLLEMDRYSDARRADAEWLMAVQSTAMAGENLLLAAEAEGLGACWMCAPLFCPNDVQQALALPADWVPQGLILLGHPAEAGRFRQRKPLASVMILR